MTISSTIRTAGPFTSGASFLFAFKVFAATDLIVYRKVNVSGVVTTLSLTTDYTVTLNANQDGNPGGTVTLVAGALPSGVEIVIVSSIDNTQPILITNQSGFYPSVINDGLDRVTAQVQQVKQQADRSIRFPATELSTSNVLPPIEQRANHLLGFDYLGGMIATADLPTQVYYGAKSANPTVRNDGNPMQSGDLYYNTVANEMRVYTGSVWSPVGAGVNDGDKGDITITGGNWAIDPGVVTGTKIASSVALAGSPTITNGNLVMGTAGTGISFAATGQAAGMTSELLDDYEEGTFTATWTGGTTSPTTPVTTTAQYTKIGRMVTVRISFGSVTTTGASGVVIITGLPFASQGSRQVAPVLAYNLDADAGSIGIVGLVGQSASAIHIYTTTDNGAWAPVSDAGGVNRHLAISATYEN